MIQPHGGTLINEELSKIEKERILGEINEFKKIQVNSETLKVIKNIALGVFSPLEGFMHYNNYHYVLEHMYLETNVAWPFPITLDVSEEEIEDLKPDDNIILIDSTATPIALMNLNDIYRYDKKFQMQRY